VNELKKQFKKVMKINRFFLYKKIPLVSMLILIISFAISITNCTFKPTAFLLRVYDK